MQIVGHGVAVGRVAIPGFQRHQLAHFFRDEIAREGDAWIESLHVAHLQCQAAALDGIAQRLALGDRDAHGLFDQHVLAGLQRADAEGHVKLVGTGNDDGIDLVVAEHVVELGVGRLGLVDGGHSLDQIGRAVAEGVEARVAGLGRRFEVGELGDGAAAEDADG